MFARSISIRLKPNSVAEFNKAFENEILPLLRKQKGFRDELALVAPNGSEVVAIHTREASFSTFHNIAAHAAS